MIFVLLGTQDAPFTRLTNMILELVEDDTWSEEIVIQAGVTPVSWENQYVTVAPFFEQTVFHRYFQEARIIITHGGAGTLFEALSAQKKTIVVPRRAEYGEHIDNHQLELSEYFAKEGYVTLGDSESLQRIIEKTSKQTFKKYEANKSLVKHIQRRLQ